MPTLQFKGKSFVQNHHLAVKFHQLVPVKGKSLTEKVSLHDNLIVQGDNLKALKALLPTYAGKVKCIYIDPPYNTGQSNSKWIYSDDVNSPMHQEWLGKEVDREDLTRHDKWLCMMLPRLRLLKDLLAPDGVIFISIDENEEHRLSVLLNEVMGDDKFIEKIIWNKRIPKNDKGIGNIHEYILLHSNSAEIKHKFMLPKAGLEEVQALVEKLKKRKVSIPDAEKKLKALYKKKEYDRGITLYNCLDEDYRIWGKINMSFPNSPDGPRYPVKHPGNGKEVAIPDNGWRWKEETLKLHMGPKSKWKQRHDGTWVCGKVWFDAEERTQPSSIQFLEDVKDFLLRSIISLKSSGGMELKQLLPGNKFPHPKTYKLIAQLLESLNDKEAIILDSFAGSGTTAHAVLKLNKEDGGNRRFILVEMEDYADTITAERVRRVIKGVPKSKNFQEGTGGTFSYFKLGDPIEMEQILHGKSLPSYEDLARYVFYTATGEQFDAADISKDKKKPLIGTSKEYPGGVYLYYEPNMPYLMGTALSLDMAKALGPHKNKKRLVFAPMKYLDQDYLDQLRIDYSQLPFEIYRFKE